MSERIQKRLAQLGLGSRREIEGWITTGRIVVNGELAILGQSVGSEDEIKVDGRSIDLSEEKKPSKHVLIYNKPEGEVCTRKDPQGRATVFDKLPAVHNGRWISVGRLDVNTSGLLIFTTDGELANKLMHPSSQIDREYAVRVLGDVDEPMLKRLTDGVELEDGPARFEEIVAPKPDEDDERANRWFFVCLQEGRNREVRRLWESQEGIKVSRLKRVRYANVFLEKKLRLGQWRYADQEELNGMYELVELEAPVLETEQEEKAERKEKHTRRTATPSTRPQAKQHRQQEQQRRRRNTSNRSR
jgi:23S rRNA pseudouridine2605 synthase